MKLEVEIHTVLVAFAVSYVVVALMIKRKQLWRWFQDAMVSLARAGFPLAKYLATPASPDEASAKLARPTSSPVASCDSAPRWRSSCVASRRRRRMRRATA